MSCPLISVIIPLYNTEAYIGEALRSVTCQTLREIEIIVINDGSTDASAHIVEALATDDPRVQLYTQVNAGQATARNRGLQYAQGEFIYFMDSDDLIEADTLLCCYEKCVAENLDFVFFDAICFGDAGANRPWFDYHRAADFEDKSYTGITLLKQMLSNRSYRCSVCLNLIRRTFIKQLGLQFKAGIIHEDELFTALLYLEAERVGRIDREFFHRRLRGFSTMTSSFSTRNVTGYLTVLEELRHYAKRQNTTKKQLVKDLTAYILNPTLRNAWQLPWQQRWLLAAKALYHYPLCLQFKPLITLLLKAPLQKSHLR